jgi:hypothetical protein
MKSIILTIAIALTFQFTFAQKTESGVTMPAKIKSGETVLTLNGIGIREKLWIDLYVAGLYLKAETKDAKKIINADEKMLLKLHIVSGLISSEKMSNAVEEGFEKSTNGKTESLRTKIDAFKAVFMKDEIKKEVVFDIYYIPGKGTVIYTDSKIQATIKGLDFKKALFGIWLGEEPADDDLKEDLLNE